MVNLGRNWFIEFILYLINISLEWSNKKEEFVIGREGEYGG